ncbi:MAG TPA: aldolase/citrate lyase family protein [Candidatus Binataceae bacterium]|jgi:4-hydroxy-2-oxoheptanedioate aldolase|nr:aldolase/citrate lyase family protein [Candidatus Binataceae bacterium]
MSHSGLSKVWSEGRAALGPWITTDSEWSIETLAHSGFDFVVIDCQHSLLDEVTAARLLKGIANAPAAGIVRVSRNEPGRIGRVLDGGADAVIVPLVNTAGEAADAVAACRYSPKGVRSFGPFRAGLGFDVKALEERVSCFVMIETTKGVENAAKICAVSGVAGVFIGPADLSVDMGLPAAGAFGDKPAAALTDAIEKIIKATQAARIVVGKPASSVADAARSAAAGYRLLAVGADRSLLRERAVQVVKEMAAKGASN